jgi:hypothetical protein
MMPTDPAAEPPNPADDKKTTIKGAGAGAPANKQPDVEYDDFGLPIRKARARTPLPASDDSSEGEEFKDAVEKTALAEKDGLKAEPATDINSIMAKEEVDKPVPALDEHTQATPTEAEDEKVDKPAEAIPAKVEGKKVDQHIEDVPAKAESDKEDEKPHEKAPEWKTPPKAHQRIKSIVPYGPVSEFSHQQLAPQTHQDKEEEKDDEGEWQTMPAYARYDMYDDDNRLIAKEATEELEDMSGYGNLGGAAKGYTRVIMDDDVESVTSMDDNTKYLFTKEAGTTLDDEDEAARDPLSQMQTTKNLLTEGQRVAYVGLVRLALVDMKKKFGELERNKNTKKLLDTMQESNQMWTQKMMVRLYSHMDISESEQVMIEQLSEHGVVPADLTPTLMQNARVKNPAAEEEVKGSRLGKTISVVSTD